MEEHLAPPPDDDKNEHLVPYLITHGDQRKNVTLTSTTPFSHAGYRKSSVAAVNLPRAQGTRLDANGKAGDNAPDLPPSGEQPVDAITSGGTLTLPAYINTTSSALLSSTPTEIQSASSPAPGRLDRGGGSPALTTTPSPDRTLPPRDVTDDTLDDAYVAFVLYCNPIVAPSTDTTELRKGFRAPPKSDGKTFNTFTLLGLIRRFESKEIRTWTQLALQLGVESPVMEKNQSAQKVQQYAVRLKVRWIRSLLLRSSLKGG